ncbi:translation elongation factor 4 [Bifidobacterium sp. ESL0682]|uniref:translation elongation factor 4 n=1 Tax=Bifidobacterium sp. ESL0682 TaxID=2983212 RepID=UPI0023F6AD13|nr:translation elongation factor 4 [Bifidobacterium sp. ESL0682]WEV42201.1 translation elongation factor 4 [Bifidobacterium sp. ESL0682]
MNTELIRNFAIIAHIDHGKSTLADRIMEQTETISEREASDQLLDDMAVEREHGVTVKSRTVRNFYRADDGKEYEYNLIDTPGHVDFSYEVSKSLAACEGAILLVDATQGVQAQTIANLRLARKNKLAILPVINKIDSPAADLERTEKQIRSLAPELEDADILYVSAKTGDGVHEVLEAVHTTIPAPSGDASTPLKALVFDSSYDPYQGVIAYLRVIDGTLGESQNIKAMASKQTLQNNEIGVFAPGQTPVKTLGLGEVGYVKTGVKDPTQLRVGDTITDSSHPATKALPGYEPAHPMVFAGFYPKGDTYRELELAVEKLSLNDSSFQYVKENSDALGPGFRCSFLGIFHLQIIRERLKNEYGLDVLTTAPNVTYRVHMKGSETVNEVDSPSTFPDYGEIDYVEEPFSNAVITTDEQELNAVMQLAEKHMGTLTDIANEGDLITVTYHIPTAEIAYDFFNTLKSISHGYATLETQFADYGMADVVKVELDVNYAPVDALAFIIHRQDAPAKTQALVEKLKYTIPRRLYPMPVQAMVEGRVLARVDVPPLRKNAAVSGEKKSISKKQALLRRQSINKRQAAKSDIKLPQEVFDAVLELSM